MKTLCLALLISMYAATGASAQSAPAVATDFSGIAKGRTVTVVDDAGQQTKGVVVRLSADQLTMTVHDREVAFERQHVVAIYERGNSVKKGMTLGLLSGPALGIAALASGGGNDPYLLPGVLIFSALGFGVGTAIDALIPGRQLIYDASSGASRRHAADDFSGLAGRRPITVTDDSGTETKGRLLRFTPDELTMIVDGQPRTFARQHVATIFEHGDSVKNGALIGLATGAALGLLSGATQNSCGGLWEGPHRCTSSEKARLAVGGALITGALGAGIGTGIDALRPGRRVIYRRPKSNTAATISIAPSVAPSRFGLQASVVW
jgi:hypothetical protein